MQPHVADDPPCSQRRLAQQKVAGGDGKDRRVCGLPPVRQQVPLRAGYPEPAAEEPGGLSERPGGEDQSDGVREE